MVKKMHKVIIVDDNQGFIEAIKVLFRSRRDLQVVGEANDAYAFFNQMEIITADIVLMDINMPKVNGLMAAKKAIAEEPHLKIIGVTMSDDHNIHTDMLRLGFRGGILKNNFSKQFDEALNVIDDGGVYFPVLD
jgi:DNA-binding NarL/FixJ family response regulator